MSRDVRREVDPELRLHPLRHPLGEPRDGVPEPCLHGGPAVAETIPETPGPFRAENEQVDAGQPLDQRADGIGHECHRTERRENPHYPLDEALIEGGADRFPERLQPGPYRLPVPDDEVDRSSHGGDTGNDPGYRAGQQRCRHAPDRRDSSGNGRHQAGDELRRQETGACDHRHEGGSDLEDRRDQHREGQDKWPGDPRCQPADCDHRRTAEQIDQRLDRLDTRLDTGPEGCQFLAQTARRIEQCADDCLQPLDPFGHRVEDKLAVLSYPVTERVHQVVCDRYQLLTDQPADSGDLTMEALQVVVERLALLGGGLRHDQAEPLGLGPHLGQSVTPAV